jgi:Flp pilus assembly pilin Flp
VFRNFTSMLRDESGQSLVEYTLIIALIAILSLTALRSIGNAANNSLTNDGNQLS